MKIIKNLFNWKYRYFKKKLNGVKCMVADLEFKRFKTQEIREDVRKEYDKARAKLDILTSKVASEKENPTQEEAETKRVEDEIVLLERDVERYKAQINEMDLSVSGCKPNQDYQDGVIGINDQLDSLRELDKMLKEYIKEL